MNKEQIQEHIQQILAEEQTAATEGDTTPLGSSTSHEIPTASSPSAACTSLVPIDYSAPTVEGEIIHIEGEPEIPTEPPLPPTHPRRSYLLLAAVALFALLGSSLATWFILPLFTASATVTLIPRQQTLTLHHTITATLDSPSSELPMRLIHTSTSKQETIPTTGTGYHTATSAHGTIYFYNAATSQQTIDAGTLLIASDGTQVIVDTTVSLPAALPPTEGSAAGTAHAFISGPGGNIATNTIQGPCCKAYVFAYNGPFFGGTTARTYRAASSQDITTATTTLTTETEQNARQAIQPLLQIGETTPPPTCHNTTISSALPNQEAATVTVKTTTSCSAEAYTQKALQDLATTVLDTHATSLLGADYQRSDSATLAITDTNTNGDHVTLNITITDTYRYSLSQTELTRIRSILAGKSRTQATSILLHTGGIAQSTIQSTHEVLPNDPNNIHILLSYPNTV